MEEKYSQPPTEFQTFDDWIKTDAGSAYGSLGDVGSVDSGHASYSHTSYSRHHTPPHFNVLLASEYNNHKYVLSYDDDTEIELPTPDYDDDDEPPSYPDNQSPLPPPPQMSPTSQFLPSSHLPPPPQEDTPEERGVRELCLDQLSSCSEKFPSKYVCDNPDLIEPKKLVNPCLESKDRKNLHRELKWNANKGIDLLQKSELHQELSRRRDTKRVKEIEDKRKNARTSFEMKLEEQANKLRLYEQPSPPAAIVEEKEEPEFQRVFSKISRNRPAYCT